MRLKSDTPEGPAASPGEYLPSEKILHKHLCRTILLVTLKKTKIMEYKIITIVNMLPFNIKHKIAQLNLSVLSISQ